MSVISWFIMTLFLFIPRPNMIECPENIAKNLSAANLFDSPDFHNKTSLMNVDEIGQKKNFITKIKSLIINSREISHVSDLHHLTVYNTDNQSRLNDTANLVSVRSISGSLVSAPSKFPVFLYDHQEIQRIFWILFILTVVGEFFEAPSVSLLDTAVLQSIDNHHNYGRVRLYGSLGFGISSFIVGLTLDHVRKTMCDKLVTNFIVIMYFFIAWMIITIILCFIFVKFPQVDASVQVEQTSIASTLMIFKKPTYSIFLLTSFYLGFAHGSIMNFINWYLEDMGANRFMMGTATIVRDLAVVLGFYISPKILGCFKIKQILFWVFSVYVFSYFAYSLIPTPWLAVPVEALQGLAFSLMWSSCINHLIGVSTPSNFVTMQGKNFSITRLPITCHKILNLYKIKTHTNQNQKYFEFY
ncbi:Major facilitator superfamily domain-containing protein 6 [Thelohanellus kitauei]|uniref:Major facilitator superfamily domain-containing protein 6 n=1 Tax=Thelohanellus kitauei TaxID=669202 RepID=A0A0C2MHJ1_THEKT|nr:Major facilitator superfamily domain-containing protein 6 [Thelohanellus kitauei]